MINREEIDNLARLARLAVPEAEKEALALDLANILQYVTALPDKSEAKEKIKPEHYNILRADENPDEPGIYTADLLAQMADRKGDFMKVKKIIDRDL